MRRTLTWLHVSDIHFRPKTEWRDSATRSSLLDYLKGIFAEDASLRPDFIFCTGDIAFGESSAALLSDQYVQARSFFDDLLSVCGQNGTPLAKQRLFIVPGNHDVNRKAINVDAQSTLTLWADQASNHIEVINQRFDDRSMEFKDAIKRLDEYAKFVQEYLPHQHDVDGRQHYVCKVEIDGIEVGIAGFNSAWTCAGPEDDRNIWLAANWQFNKALEGLKDADIRIGLMHHPVDWVNSAERDIATRRIASDFTFWLHGHSHNAWVTPVQSHIVVAAGAVGAETSDEFGVNVVCLDAHSRTGVVHLHNKKAGSNGWTIAPVAVHAPKGKWVFDLPTTSRWMRSSLLPSTAIRGAITPSRRDAAVDKIFVDRHLTRALEDALLSFSSQPKVWVTPILSRRSEVTQDAKSEPKVDLSKFIENPKSTIIKAPPQYGLTCLSHYLALEAWRAKDSSLWLYLDSKQLKPHTAAIEKAVADELAILGCTEHNIKCVILDSWFAQDKDAFKLLRNLSDRFKDLPIICMLQADGDGFNQPDNSLFPREFEILYLWSLPRGQIREIVAAYNEARQIGDEDAVIARLVSDLDVLNLHRTALNCLTLLKASEVDFDESPVNRCEMIKRVLFLLFNVDEIPTYKTRPDLTDCEYVLGYFCEILIREGTYSFPRDRFLLEIQRFCKERLIDLETNIVFDVLYTNNILVKRGSFFSFRFSYWICYFAAHRMHHDQAFANFIFDGMRYTNYPEIIEFYTGIDRSREDALKILIKDIRASSEVVKERCGFPDELNPYRHLKWIPSPEAQAKMQQEIADGVRESNLPAAIKDQYADRHYDPSRPYDQRIREFLTEHSFTNMVRAMKAGARALRNSDYVSPVIKRELLKEILYCWEQASKVMLVVLPLLAKKGIATYDGTGFILIGDFGATTEERAKRILNAIPSNVVSWCEEDLFSKKMGTLLIDLLSNKAISEISRHELILLLIHKRPRDWHKEIHRYIASNEKNSFYLFDVYVTLRGQYRFSFASPQTLRDMENLLEMVATKHVTGEKEPGVKSIAKTIKRLKEPLIPPREV